MPNESKVKLKYSLGRTLNLGNYESARIDIGMEGMAGNEKSEIERFWKAMKKWVDDKVEEELERFQNE
jgi:hypothetical protein